MDHRYVNTVNPKHNELWKCLGRYKCANGKSHNSIFEHMQTQMKIYNNTKHFLTLLTHFKRFMGLELSFIVRIINFCFYYHLSYYILI